MFDIEIAGYILNSTLSKYNVEILTQIYLDIDISDIQEEQKQISLFNESKEQSTYSKKSAVSSYYIYKLYKVLIEKLKETNQLELFNEIEMPLLEVLAEIQLAGMYIDKKALIQFGEELDKKIDELTKNIYQLANEEFNINSSLAN